MANKTYSDARANLDLEYEMYAREKLTLSEVAEARGVLVSTVCVWANKHGGWDKFVEKVNGEHHSMEAIISEAFIKVIGSDPLGYERFS